MGAIYIHGGVTTCALGVLEDTCSDSLAEDVIVGIIGFKEKVLVGTVI
jgi:hypothetical protein